MSAELRLRILSGIVLAVVVLAATWLGGLAFRLLAALIAILVFYEWVTITRQPKGSIATGFGYAGVVLIAAEFVVRGDTGGFVPSVVLLVGFTVVAAILCAFRRQSYWLAGGVFYAGLSGISLAALRGANADGLVTMLYIFGVVWATDIFAYFVGRAIGGPKLAPPISPGKTWSGAIGGTIAAVIAGLLVIHFTGHEVSIGLALVSAVLSIASQIGDLFESWIKRRFGVKDSSRLIPGHGGVMDRVDGLVFACFLAFLGGLAMSAFSGELVRDANVAVAAP